MSEGPYGIGSSTWPGLAKVVEESGEVIQVLGKIVARGGDLVHIWEQPDGTILGSGDLTPRLHEELGDLLAAVDFLILNNDDIDANLVDIRRIEKSQTYQRWHNERTVAP